MIARGNVTGVRGALLEAELPGAAIGAGVRIATACTGTVRAINGRRVLIAAHADAGGIARGADLRTDPRVNRLPFGTCALGRAFDGTGAALDDGPPIRGRMMPLSVAAPAPDERQPVNGALWTGVRAIDGLLTIGRGTRVGLFGAPGAGKSTLLESIAEGAEADAVVVGLIGERGREAREWIARRTPRMSVVCATSDRSASERLRAAEAAVAQARALAARGLHVLLVLDSLARYAAALRELAVAAGEPAGRAGFPPSVFAALARFVERCGAGRSGSVTLLASVLSDGDDRDPISDAARSLLDGHIALSAHLAGAGRFPAIDILGSASRTMPTVASPEHIEAASRLRRALAALERAADARSLGIESADPETMQAAAAEERIEHLLRQGRERTPWPQTLRMMAEIADTLREPHGYSD